MVYELFDGAGRVIVVAVPTGRGGVQQADVEQPGARRRVVARKVFQRLAIAKTLAVHGGADLRQLNRLGLARRQQPRALAPGDMPGEHRGRVVIAPDGDHPDTGAGQPADLPHQKMPGAPVLPVPVEQVAGDDHEIQPLGEREIHRVAQCQPRRRADALGRRLRIGLQPAQRAVQVQIGKMQEAEAAHEAIRRQVGNLSTMDAPSPAQRSSRPGWCRRTDLNCGPTDYESVALPLSYVGGRRGV